MVSYVKSVLLNFRDKKIVSNFLFLSIIQLSNYIAPVIIIPYLVSTLGVENYGLIAFSNAVISYFLVFVDYGYNLTATRDIALNRSEPNKIVDIFNTVLSTKMVLGGIGFLMVYLLIILVEPVSNHKNLFLLSYSIVLGHLIFPFWFFQGMEDMKYITYISLLTKLIYIVLVLIFVKVPSDYIYVNLFYGISGIISGLLSIVIIVRKYKITFKVVSMQNMLHDLRGGFLIFMSNIATNIYTNSNIIILESFTNNLVVGYFSIAEKVILALRQLLTVYAQVIYPRVCLLFEEGLRSVVSFFSRAYVPFLMGIIIISSLIFSFSDIIVRIIAGKNVVEIENIINILIIVPVIVCLNIPFSQILLSFNKRRAYSIIMIVGAAINIVFNLFLVPLYGALGSSYSIIITELFISLTLAVYVFWQKQIGLL